MAESDETTTTPADDGRARVLPNGKVDTGGRKAFVWCQDDVTGHRFDLFHQALPKRGVTVVEGYPLNFKRFGRPGKTRLQLADDPAETGGAGDQPAPEISPSGDQQRAATAAAETEAGSDAATTTKNRRPAR